MDTSLDIRAEKASRGLNKSQGGMNVKELRGYIKKLRYAHITKKTSREELEQILFDYYQSKKDSDSDSESESESENENENEMEQEAATKQEQEIIQSGNHISWLYQNFGLLPTNDANKSDLELDQVELGEYQLGLKDELGNNWKNECDRHSLDHYRNILAP